MAAAQQDDQEMDTCVTSDSGLSFQGIKLGPTNTTLLCDVSTGQPRPIVPRSFRKTVFDVIHGLSHPSIRTTQKLITDRYVWKGVRKQVAHWTKTCKACQEAKVQQHTRAPPQVFKVPHRRFDHIHIDIVGPLPPSQGYTHLLTIVDRFTRWPEAIPLKETDTETCARALVLHWIARFGMPLDLTSDRGSQFTSKLWSIITKLLGIKLHRNNGIPSPGKRLGGTFSPTFENFSPSMTYRPQLVGCTTMGIAGHSYSPQRGPQMLFGRAGIWCPHHSPR